jgi:hypothetical protein
MEHSMRAGARRNASLAAVAVGLALVAGCTNPGGGGGGGAVGGAVGVTREADPGLPQHVIYHQDMAKVTKPQPIVVWGETACAPNGTIFPQFLGPLAAKGVFVIASGGLTQGTGSTTWQLMTQSMDWAVKENARQGSKYFGKLDVNAISLQGQSCGGLEALHASADPRVKSTILWNSGAFATGGLGGASKADLAKLHGPTAWLNGGPSDIAYQNAVDDYAKVPDTVPAVLGSYGNVGHMGLWTNTALSAQMATVSRNWVDATIYGDAAAKAQFVGSNCGLCSGTQWKLQSKNW